MVVTRQSGGSSRHGSGGGIALESPAFFHSNKPQAVPSKRSRPKYRVDEDFDIPLSNNIMHDRRVVRGNTYQAQLVTSNQQRELDRVGTKEEIRQARERVARRQAGMSAPRTPPPVPGRQHMDVQTDEYLEELSDRPVEKEAETQTHPFMDRPSSPLFVPAKTGSDAHTQIEAGELFDFDAEVVPILEVLVGKTLETAFYEVLEEEEIAALCRRQADFEKMRNAELAEVQRLEAEAKRRDDEKLRRLEQEKERIRQRRSLEEKVAARSYARSYLSELQDSVFDTLETEGAFYDPLKKEIEDQFMPWVIEKVKEALAQSTVASAVMDNVIMDALETVKHLQSESRLERDAEVQRQIQQSTKAQEEEEEAAALAKAALEKTTKVEDGGKGEDDEEGTSPSAEE